jgi:hypothetical protein
LGRKGLFTASRPKTHIGSGDLSLRWHRKADDRMAGCVNRLHSLWLPQPGWPVGIVWLRKIGGMHVFTIRISPPCQRPVWIQAEQVLQQTDQSFAVGVQKTEVTGPPEAFG